MADLLYLQVVIDERQLLAQGHESVLLAQQAPQDCGQPVHYAARLIGIGADQGRHRIQCVEQEVRVHLTRQVHQARLNQQALLVLDLPLVAGVVPDLERQARPDQGRQIAQQQRRQARLSALVEVEDQPATGELVANGLHHRAGQQQQAVEDALRIRDATARPRQQRKEEERREAPDILRVPGHLTQQPAESADSHQERQSPPLERGTGERRN